MGAQYMDYLIADHTLIPQAAQCHYSEKIVYMPDSYQVNDSRRAISPIPCARFQEGLPETAFVFCCFNNIYKISPDSFDSWMRILGRVLGSVLWLLEDNPSAVENLRKRAALRGIDPQRLVFAKRMPVDQHLIRQGLADLVLDTLPYNAHTTASDALWVGLPVLTRGTEVSLPIHNQPNTKQMKPPYRHYTVGYTIDIHNIEFNTTPDGNYHGAFEYGIRVYNADGDEIVNSASKEARLILTPAVYQSMLKNGAISRDEIDVPAKGDYFLRIAVHDLTSDRVGAIEVSTVSIKPDSAPAVATAPGH